MSKKKEKEVKPELESSKDNTTENQEIEQSGTAVEVEAETETETISQTGLYVNLKDYDPNKPIEIYGGEDFSGEDVFTKNETESEVEVNGEQEAQESETEIQVPEVESQEELEEQESESEPEREITEYDMLVMEDTGIGLAKTSLKVKVNRVSPFLREKILIDDNTKDSVGGYGEDYILLSATNAYPRQGLKRGQIITCI